MKAWRFHNRRDLRFEDLPMPQPGQGEVLLRVTDAGLSQTQIAEFMEGPFIISKDRHPRTGFEGPIIPCQEYGGIVEAVGEGVSDSLVGAQMAALPLVHCGTCRPCRTGRENLCETLAYRGLLGADGGFCAYSVVHESQLFPVEDPSMLNFIEPILVGIHSLKRANTLGAERVLVQGAGAVGCAVAAVWQDCGGLNVDVFDLLPNRCERAAAMGLSVLDAEPEVGAYDVVVEAAGKDLQHGRTALLEAFDYTASGGTVLSLGTYFSPISFVPMTLTIPERNDFGALTTFVPLEELVESGYYQAEVDKDEFTRIITAAP